jgi:hypothetical protein
MNIFNRFYEKFFHSRDKPQNALMGSMQYFFGRSVPFRPTLRKLQKESRILKECYA